MSMNRMEFGEGSEDTLQLSIVLGGRWMGLGGIAYEDHRIC